MEQTFDELVRSGKIRYAGLSDVPAWYAARAQSYAEAHGLAPMVTVQLPYSLATRAIEPEYLPMAQALGFGITAWSPLAGGILTGKYKRTADGLAGDGRFRNPEVAGLPVTDPLPQPYAMFIPEFQTTIVGPDLGIGDKPGSFSPPVWNGPARS